MIRYQMALAQMEAGAVDAAADSIRQALQLNPMSPFRPTLRFYLECLTDEKVDLAPTVPEAEDLADLTESVVTPPDANP